MKKSRGKGTRIHALEVPLEGANLLVPSAAVAEVINPQALTLVPLSQPWLRGAIGWRTLAVPVISFEVLLGGYTPANVESGKIVIFYPLSGRKEWEFFAMYATGEPRPQQLDGGETTADAIELLESSYIAAGLKIDDRVMFIPNLEALKKTFYSG